MAVQLMFWFHPLLWWIGSRLVAERERACDESVLAAGNDPKDYAGSILEVCRFYARSPLACASGVAGANLKDRVTRILENVGLARLSDLKRAILGTGAIGAVVFPMASGLFAIEPAAAYPAASAAVPAAYRSSLLPARKPAVPSTAKARLIDMPIASGPEPGAFVAASATVAAAEVSNAANAPRVQAQLPRAVEERVAPETLLAQADAAGASVPPPASSPALTPPPSSPLDEIVVTAKRVREFVQTRNFVRMYTAPSSFLDQISRWQAPVCVHTVGLKPAYNAFVTARLK